MESDLGPIPKLRINESVKYLGCKAKIVGCLWDGIDTWRYEVYISRGKHSGIWSVTEETLIKGGNDASIEH